MSDIVEYVKNNDIENVKKCLESDNTFVDARDEESKFTLLMICAKKGYFDIAKLLVEEGANLNARSRTGITALMFACAEKQVKIAEYLIDSGADVNLRDKPLFSALLYACLTKEYNIIKALVEAGADVNKVGCEQVLSPLEWVAILPLQFVEAEHDEIQALESLIKTGTDYCNLPNIISKPCKDITPSELISIKKSIHEIYLKAKEKHNPLFLDMLEILINNKANIHQIDFAGQTVLHRAALTPKGETLELMKYLILKGADVNAKDSNGNTPLFIAYAVNNNDAVNLLIASGADVSIKNNFGVTYKQIVGTRKRDIYQEDGTFNTVNDNFN